ncbi:MAG: JAB domain-containing protein [Chlorobiaceae bacterium]|nr:JAB domain-containing protein [Chlorobiaceae bacterium]NTV59845.1 JAB domain-containing protein [Chlorobiaceae bacterium]
MKSPDTLPLFTIEEQHIVIPRYSIRLVRETEVYYGRRRIKSPEMICELFMTIGLHEKAGEEFHSVYLNTKNEIIGMEMISKGTLNASLVHPREVFKGALLANANALILVHNHPSGHAEPGDADRMVTEKLVEAGKILDVKILDHVIIASRSCYFSFFEHALLNS